MPGSQEEIFKARLQALKREEELARGELARLEAEKIAHIRWVCCLERLGLSWERTLSSGAAGEWRASGVLALFGRVATGRS